MNYPLALLTLVISILALLFSVFTWRERKSKDRRDLFLSVYERLIDKDVQRGRRILVERVNSINDAKALRRDQPDEYDLVNTSIAMLEIAALYACEKYIDRELFMREWAGVYARCLNSGHYFLRERVSRNANTSLSEWRHFICLGEEADVIRRTDHDAFKDIASRRLAPGDLLS